MVECDGSETAVILYTSGTTANQGRGVKPRQPWSQRGGRRGGPARSHFRGHCVRRAAALPRVRSNVRLNASVSRARASLSCHASTRRRRWRFLLAITSPCSRAYRRCTARWSTTGLAKFDLSALRLCVTGGSAMPVEIMRGFERNFGCSVLEGYGLTETSPVASFNHPDRPSKPGSIAPRSVGGDEGGRRSGQRATRRRDRRDRDPWAQRDEGLLEEHGGDRGGHAWRLVPFRDLARTDEDGYYFIVDRKTDMIIRVVTTSTPARSKMSSTSTRRSPRWR